MLFCAPSQLVTSKNCAFENLSKGCMCRGSLKPFPLPPFASPAVDYRATPLFHNHSLTTLLVTSHPFSLTLLAIESVGVDTLCLTISYVHAQTFLRTYSFTSPCSFKSSVKIFTPLLSSCSLSRAFELPITSLVGHAISEELPARIEFVPAAHHLCKTYLVDLPNQLTRSSTGLSAHAPELATYEKLRV